MTGAQLRIELPGSGSVHTPRCYASDQRRSFRASSIALYRKLRHTLGGYEECDGLISMARRDAFSDLDAFATETENSATTRWLHGDLRPGWTSFEGKKFPIQRNEGPAGRERIQELTVNTSGLFKATVNVAWRVALEHRTGLLVQVWLFEKHGGIATARKLADEITASFST